VLELTVPRFSHPDAKRISDSVRFTETLTRNRVRNPGAAPASPSLNPAEYVRVHNKTGSDLQPGDPVRLKYSGETFNNSTHEFRASDTYWAHTPTDELAGCKLAIVDSAIETDAFGRAIIGGVATVTVNITDTSHSAVVLEEDEFTSSSSGYTILAWHTQDGEEGISDGEQLVRIYLGSAGGTTLVKGRVTTEITAAEGPLAADWGEGEVAMQDAATGTVSETPVAVDNDNIGTSWAIDCQVVLDTSHSPPRVVGGSCGPVNWGE